MKPHLLLLATLIGLALSSISPTGFAAEGWAGPLPPLPEATAARLPRWRGFNLTEKFNLGTNKPFAEEDFQIISELGFNFARLPMDYRIWIKNGDWRQINEAAFAEIDQALAYGAKYGVHICINFHRAPGYTVATPKEARDLWTDPEAQEVCAMHWAYFARRYKGISNRRLSFDLLNEPANISPETYRAVAGRLVQAIRREDPQRLIIADGLKWGTVPCPELADLAIAQATRGYTPLELTHYHADWMHRPMQMVPPPWPMPEVSSVLKQGYPPKEAPKEIVVEGPFAATTAVTVRITKVQPPCEVTAEVAGQLLTEQSWQAKLEKPVELRFEIPAGSGSLKLGAKTGWALASTLTLRPKTGPGAGRDFIFEPWENWQIASAPLRFVPGDAGRPFQASAYFDRAWLRARSIEPWQALQARGVGVMVGEFGVYNQTPHATALAFLKDALSDWKEAGWGWALWNLSGPFGILDSGRSDVVYEKWHGHKLDRAMLTLLQQY